MKTIHHCIFTIKLLTARRPRSFIGYILQGWTKRKVTHQWKHEKLKLSNNKKADVGFFWDDVDAQPKRRTERKKAGQDISTATDKTERSNKVIKECLPFAHERSTAKPHLFPLPLSLSTHCHLHLLAVALVRPLPLPAPLPCFLSSSAPLWPSYPQGGKVISPCWCK